MESPLEARFNLSERDFIDANIYMNNKVNPVPRILLIVFPFGLLVLVGLLAYAWMEKDRKQIIRWIALFLLAAFFYVYFIKTCITSRRELKQRVRDETKNEVNKERVVRLTAEGISEDCDDRTQVMTWPSIKQIVPAKEFTVVCHGDNAYYIIPKRGFTQETEWSDFLVKANEYWASAKAK
jgi:hypothetical protein